MKIQTMTNKPTRFVIMDDEGAVIDDAQGYGYKSSKAASKAMWYKFGGGKQKKLELERQKRKFFREHPDIEPFINSLYETWFKELARGEVTTSDFAEEIQKKFGVTIPEEFLI